MKEICEQAEKCNTDEKSFKAYLARWMGHATQLAPFTYEKSIALLKSSAKAAAAQCIGGPTGRSCGLKWYLNGTWDGTDGAGQQMSALETFQATMIQHVPPPLTNSTGGTSISDPTAGHNSSAVPPGAEVSPPTKSDKIGAWFLTAFIVVMAVWTCWFMWSTAWEQKAGQAGAGGLNEKSAATAVDVKGKGKAPAVIPVARNPGVLSPVVEEVRPMPKYRGGDLVT